MCNVEDATVRAKRSHSRCHSADVRWLPARSSIDRSLEDKSRAGGRKKIVITATIVVDKRRQRVSE